MSRATYRHPARSVYTYPVTALDPLGRHRRPDDGRDPELARDDGGMRRHAAGVRDEPGDLREQHDPRRIRHLADEDLALLYLVELVERGDAARDALDDAGRGAEPVHLVDLLRRRAVKLLGEAPERPVRERERLLRRGADPLRRSDERLLLALVPAVGDDRPRVEGLGVGRQQAELVVAEVEHVLLIVERAGLDQLPPDCDRGETHARVRALVDEEVVVGRERVHPQRELERLPEPVLPLTVRHAVEELRLRRGQVVADRLDRGRVVVVGLEIPADGLDDRRGALLPGRERELVRPDRLVAELLPVRAQPLVQEAAAALGALERADHVGGGLAPERLAQLVVALDLLLHLPERLDRIPVPVLDRALQAAEERRVGLALHLRDGRVQRHRRGELREVEHPVDLPVTVVDVERVLEEHHELDQRGAVGVVPVQVGEVPLDLGAQPVTPPVEEVAGVVGQDEAQVRTHLRRVLGVVRDAGRVARLELVRLRPHGRVGRDRRRVEVAVHVLRHPVRRERRREAPEHVVARQPPPAQVEIERRQRVGAVEVVQHPEELRLAGLPLDRKRLVTLEGGEDLWCLHRHLQPPSAQ